MVQVATALDTECVQCVPLSLSDQRSVLQLAISGQNHYGEILNQKQNHSANNFQNLTFLSSNILIYVFANNPHTILGKGSFNKFIQLAESWIDRCIDYIKIDRDREIERKKDR